MTYGYNGNKRGRKQSRSKTKQLEVRRILASLTMAAGILAMPFSVGEAAITRENGTVLDGSGTVHNIDPEKVVSTDFAYNRFKQFNLDAGHIANLKFSDGTTTAATLANLVNNQVTINGIVNAVKGGAIDGHLIFLSPNGIAVGSTGVINAGSFTGIVPTKDAFDKIYNANNSDASATITQKAVEDIQKGAYATKGTINISGHINTRNGIMLGAGVININNGAVLQSTKNVQFTEVVNTGSNSGVAFAEGVGEGGDIILKAKQSSVVNDTTIVKDQDGQDKIKPIRWSERSTDLSAAVNIGTNNTGANSTTTDAKIINSDGAVNNPVPKPNSWRCAGFSHT